MQEVPGNVRKAKAFVKFMEVRCTATFRTTHMQRAQAVLSCSLHFLDCATRRFSWPGVEQ